MKRTKDTIFFQIETIIGVRQNEINCVFMKISINLSKKNWINSESKKQKKNYYVCGCGVWLGRT